jgi:hypothetical protein
MLQNQPEAALVQEFHIPGTEILNNEVKKREQECR